MAILSVEVADHEELKQASSTSAAQSTVPAWKI